MDDSNPSEPTPFPSLEGRGDSGETNLIADPEIQALLDFEPAARKRVVEGAWTPELQREYIARLAVTGSIGRSAEEMGKTDSGARKLYRTPEATSFRAAWDGAVALAKRRKAERVGRAETVAPGARPPSLDSRLKWPSSPQPSPGGEGEEGERLNEFGEWEDEGSFQHRYEEARDSICKKLLGARRLYLQHISGSPGKRAAFEILTELPIDWVKAAALQPQDDEPWHRVNQRQPDMILTAENGWTAGEFGYGEDKKARLRALVDADRAERGLPPVDWDKDD